jgi:hypothetical protein
MRGLIPDTLYDLLFGFLFGPSWSDANGETHLNHCASDVWFNWCKSNPHKHPRDFFKKDFSAFKNSIRVYAPDLDDYFDSIKDDYPPLRITQNGLESFDSYLDVGRFKYIIGKILRLMTDDRFSNHSSIHI